MTAIRPLFLAALTAVFWMNAAVCDEPPRHTLATGINPAALHDRKFLGALEVSPATKVEVYARRHGPRLLLQAVCHGSVVGRAETIAGLKTTPIYVKVDGNTSRIDVLWETRK